MAAFLVNGAITRGVSGTKTFLWTYPSYMQSFIKIHGAVLKKNDYKRMILCNFDKDNNLSAHLLLLLLNSSILFHQFLISHLVFALILIPLFQIPNRDSEQCTKGSKSIISNSLKHLYIYDL